jgi:hypothetical protein
VNEAVAPKTNKKVDIRCHFSGNTPQYFVSYIEPVSHNCQLNIFTFSCSTPIIKVFVYIPQSRSATSNSLISALMYCGRAISDQNSDIHEAGNAACSGTVLFRLYMGE